MYGNIFSNLPPLANIFGKNSGQNKNLLQGMIGFGKGLVSPLGAAQDNLDLQNTRITVGSSQKRSRLHYGGNFCHLEGEGTFSIANSATCRMSMVQSMCDNLNG